MNPEPDMPMPLEASLVPEKSARLDCWNLVGSYGNNQCAELANLVHCHHCPTYTTAGTQLLQREVPESFRREWTEHFARRRAVAKPGEKSGVLFKVGSEWLALPTQVVQEVAERKRIHSLPHRNDEMVLGLANLRGELTICISLGHLLAMARVPSRETLRNEHRLLLVANWTGNRLAFPVEDVSGMERFRAEDLKSPPVPVASATPGLIQGILDRRGSVVGMLDPEILFSAVERILA